MKAISKNNECIDTFWFINTLSLKYYGYWECILDSLMCLLNFMFKSHLFFGLLNYIYISKIVLWEIKVVNKINTYLISKFPLYQSSKSVREDSQMDTLPPSDKDERYGFPHRLILKHAIIILLVSLAKRYIQILESARKKLLNQNYWFQKKIYCMFLSREIATDKNFKWRQKLYGEGMRTL